VAWRVPLPKFHVFLDGQSFEPGGFLQARVMPRFRAIGNGRAVMSSPWKITFRMSGKADRPMMTEARVDFRSRSSEDCVDLPGARAD